MNRKILFVLPLSWIAVGCATVGVSSPGDCHVASIIPDVCQGPKDKPKVNFNTNKLEPKPANVCAAPGTTLVIQITPVAQNKIGSVAVVPKNPNDSWLAGTNSPDKKEIKILIPDWVEEGRHDYGFVTFDGKCLDPRVHVVD